MIFSKAPFAIAVGTYNPADLPLAIVHPLTFILPGPLSGFQDGCR